MCMRLSLTVALLVATLALLPAPSTAQLIISQPTPLNFAGRPLRLCASDRPPLTRCEVGQNSSQVVGLTPDLFRAAADRVGWVEGTDYFFECTTMSSPDIVADLISDNSTCDAGMSAIVVTSERQDAGVQFAWPHYSAHTSALVTAEDTTPTGWAWTKPFTLGLWMAIIVTTIVWPACIFILEAYALRGHVKLRHVVVGLEESVWRSLWALCFGETIQLATLGAKVAAGCFAFMSLILSSAYTASLASFLTLRNANTVSSIAELVGSAVASTAVVIPRLKSDYGIIASDANITDAESIMLAADRVTQGKLKAFVYDAAILQWTAANYPGCKLQVIDDILPSYYAIPFSKNLDPTLVKEFSEEVFKVMETGLIQELESQYINTGSICFDTIDTAAESVQIDFLSLYGLWVILAAGLAFGSGVMLANRWHRQHRKRRLKTMRSQNRSASRSAAKPGIIDLIFTPQLSFKAPKESDLHGPTSDLVEISEDDDESDED